jgi:hypothetical protein
VGVPVQSASRVRASHIDAITTADATRASVLAQVIDELNVRLADMTIAAYHARFELGLL